MLTTSRWILRIMNWLNWGVGLIVVIGGTALGYALPDQFLAAAAQSGTQSPEALLGWIRIVFPLTAPVIILAHIIFTRLIAIIDDTRAGNSFSPANADRLQTVAWALLGTQVIDLIYGIYSQAVSEASGEYLGWSFSLTGWIAVLLLFVLARVFREGAAMRDDLAGTV